MGKSLILDHFTQNSTAENFFLKIVLNACTKTLSLLKNQKIKTQSYDHPMDFIIKSLLNKNEEQEISILKELAKEAKLILMFDGLDEVNDYKDQVIHLIDALNRDETFRLNRILITTRNHLRNELEDHFGTFPFDLNDFDDEDQKIFLLKYWRSLSSTSSKEMNDDKLLHAADELITQIKSSSPTGKSIKQFIGIPLQTKMLSDIFSEQIQGDACSHLKINSIAELYKEFVESKIRIQYEEKSQIEIERDPDRFDAEKENFYADHIKLSASILYGKNREKFAADCKERDQKRLVKYGVVVAFTNGIPSFLHQSFAEFFLAKSCLQKLIDHKENDKELEQVLRYHRHFLVRKFLNDLIESGLKQHGESIEQQENKSKNGDFNLEIENCCRENLMSLLEFFIEQKETSLTAKNAFLTIASEKGHQNVVAYLLAKGIDVNQQDKNGETSLTKASRWNHIETVEILLQTQNISVNLTTALLEASFQGHRDIVQLLVENKDIDVNQQSDDYDDSALLLASQKGLIEIVQLLLNSKDINVNQQNKRGQTALMDAATHGHKEIVRLLLEIKHLNVNQENKDGKTALIIACEEGEKEIVEMLLRDENINVNQQEKVDGWTALMEASYRGHTAIVQMLLQIKNIDVHRQNKQDAKTALVWASEHGHQEIVKLLVDREDKNVN